MTDGSLQGGDATDDGGGKEVGVVVVVVVVGLGRRGQMSRWIWHRPEMGGGGERGQRSVRRRLIWNGRGRVEFELSNDGRARANLRSLCWSRRSSTAKTGGLGLIGHCAGGAAGQRQGTVWLGRAGDWVLEGWRFADSPVSLPRVATVRESRVPAGGRWSGQKLWKAGKRCWNCRWFCGSVGVPLFSEALPGVQRAGKQCPASPWAGGTGVGSNARALRELRSWGSCAVASVPWL